MTDNTELKRLAEALIAATDSYMDDECNDYLATNWAAADDAYQKATLPETFLALITENDRLESEAVYSAAGFDAAREEISKLRAENAGLRTGYEAYERVNAELKAEVELLRSLLGQSALAATTLRTDAEAYANHSGFNRVFVDLIRSISGVEVGHGYGSSKYPQQADVVAALGQGEQS